MQSVKLVHCKNLGTFLRMCDMEILPGPITMITKQLASNNMSSSVPPRPVKTSAPFTTKIAPSMITESNDADTLVNPPIINSIPGTNSANAIGNCISAGIPSPDKNSTNPGSNLPKECMMNIIPIVTRTPKCATSCKMNCRIAVSAIPILSGSY